MPWGGWDWEFGCGDGEWKCGTKMTMSSWAGPGLPRCRGPDSFVFVLEMTCFHSEISVGLEYCCCAVCAEPEQSHAVGWNLLVFPKRFAQIYRERFIFIQARQSPFDCKHTHTHTQTDRHVLASPSLQATACMERGSCRDRTSCPPTADQTAPASASQPSLHQITTINYCSYI